MCGGLWWLWLVGLCLCLVISLLFLLRFLLRLLLRFLATGVAERVLAEGLRAGLGLVAFVGDGFTDVAVEAGILLRSPVEVRRRLSGVSNSILY